MKRSPSDSGRQQNERPRCIRGLLHLAIGSFRHRYAQ
jgi:hypothetical protein